ncbi:MAG: 2-oxoacid:acceptor oxidoreductase family protein [Armatimonadetes bacterium]|nr:2-oxoacid:acceptor oxidoreductase family protein [Armatimonadota bacterium]
MQEDLIIAGFGGQGIMLIGQLLVYSALEENKNVLWMPSYGPETRGGFANCTVIISNEEIGSPIVAHPQSMIIMNLPSLDRFEDELIPQGLMIVNDSLINRKIKREDINFYLIPATEIADNLGNAKAANMVDLGAYLKIKNVVDFTLTEKTLEKFFANNSSLIELNKKALERGAQEIAKETLKP